MANISNIFLVWNFFFHVVRNGKYLSLLFPFSIKNECQACVMCLLITVTYIFVGFKKKQNVSFVCLIQLTGYSTCIVRILELQKSSPSFDWIISFKYFQYFSSFSIFHWLHWLVQMIRALCVFKRLNCCYIDSLPFQ